MSYNRHRPIWMPYKPELRPCSEVKTGTAAMLARSVLKRHLPETELATRRGGESLRLLKPDLRLSLGQY
ncbi:hypothetical protein [Nocardia arthritidis]|uniref:hypothetical protein n=1 Tax=Nocardia arthritidis TaxID=228602 RepID=UPI000AAAB762|nr:hypothetical protein [Nocardia arthritidis]